MWRLMMDRFSERRVSRDLSLILVMTFESQAVCEWEEMMYYRFSEPVEIFGLFATLSEGYKRVGLLDNS